MKVRQSKEEDIRDIMGIYAFARQFMKEQGNPIQWREGYPSKQLIEEDILSNHSFVVEKDGKIVGTFAFIIGEDPTYQIIEKGAWRSSETYGTIHRIASNGQVKDSFSASFLTLSFIATLGYSCKRRFAAYWAAISPFCCFKKLVS